MDQSQRNRKIKRQLDKILSEFNRTDYLEFDPLGIVYSYSHHRDQELAGLVAALFAFGNVTSIRKTLREILKPIGDRPSLNLESMSDKEIQKAWGQSYYRFYSSADITELFFSLRSLLKRKISFEDLFFIQPGNLLQEKLPHFRNLLRSQMRFESPGIKFMLPNPQESAAKRWHLYLRWMVRQESPDLGLWSKFHPRELIQPLDTHLFDIGRSLGLITLKSPSLKAAQELTNHFLKWAPEDPIRYDFALCQVGIQKQKKQRFKDFKS